MLSPVQVQQPEFGLENYSEKLSCSADLWLSSESSLAFTGTTQSLCNSWANWIVFQATQLACECGLMCITYTVGTKSCWHAHIVGTSSSSREPDAGAG